MASTASRNSASPCPRLPFAAYGNSPSAIPVPAIPRGLSPPEIRHGPEIILPNAVRPCGKTDFHDALYLCRLLHVRPQSVKRKKCVGIILKISNKFFGMISFSTFSLDAISCSRTGTMAPAASNPFPPPRRRNIWPLLFGWDRTPEDLQEAYILSPRIFSLNIHYKNNRFCCLPCRLFILSSSSHSHLFCTDGQNRACILTFRVFCFLAL